MMITQPDGCSIYKLLVCVSTDPLPALGLISHVVLILRPAHTHAPMRVQRGVILLYIIDDVGFSMSNGKWDRLEFEYEYWNGGKAD